MSHNAAIIVLGLMPAVVFGVSLLLIRWRYR